MHLCLPLNPKTHLSNHKYQFSIQNNKPLYSSLNFYYRIYLLFEVCHLVFMIIVRIFKFKPTAI